MKLILIRHGETDHNKSGIHMGQLDVPLNERGKKQAELVAKRLADEKIDVVYSSDLQRASFTAQCIAKHHAHLKVQHDSLLRERNVGVLSGQPIKPEDSIRKSRSGGIDRLRRPENGESISDVKVRAKAWMAKVMVAHPNDTVVVAGHGLYLFVLLEVAVEAGADTDREDFILDNTSVTYLELDQPGQARIIHLNDTAHLQGTVGKINKE